MISVKLLAFESFQSSTQDHLHVSQPTVRKVSGQFLEAMVKRSNEFIYMPRNSNEQQATKRKIYDIAGFPGALGIIDGTHIPMIAPSEDEYAYVNR